MDIQFLKSKEQGDGDPMWFSTISDIITSSIIFDEMTKLILFHIITGAIPSYDKLWLIGDEFLMKAVGHLFGCKPELDDKWFMKEHFTIKHFHGNNLELYTSMLGRIRHQLVKAINEEVIFPKVILVLLDNDLIIAANEHN